MTRFNTFDEALINADLDMVYDEMLREFGGNRSWWKALWESESRNGIAITQTGGSINIIVHDILDARFAARTVAVIEKERLDIEFFEGDFKGTATWRWAREGNKTRVSQHWQTSPNSLKFRLLSHLLDLEKIHSKVIRGGFLALNSHLKDAGKSSA